VVSLDANRFFNVGLPQVLSSNQPLLAEIMGKLDSVRNDTGIDLRKFERISVGVTFTHASQGKLSMEPVVLARGSFAAGALVAVAKLASNGAYREEKLGSRTIYVFSAKQAAKKNLPKPGNPRAAGMLERSLDSLTSEIAVTALDENTLALGTLVRVRQTLEAKTHVDADLAGLLSRNTGSIMSFAARTPAGLGAFFPMDNDELGKNLDSIKFISGSMDVREGSAVMQMMARTLKPEQAQSLLETLQGLQMVGKAFLSGAKGADKQVYARMVDNAKLARTGSDVTLDLQIPQGDINVLVGQIK
jgi:hypothetical protein